MTDQTHHAQHKTPAHHAPSHAKDEQHKASHTDITSNSAKRTIVTAALPYANGPIHIGHLLEYIQTDIIARSLKLSGEDTLFCCAEDTHGAPIEIKAMQLGIPPEELVGRYQEEHTLDFNDYHIRFDSFYTTNSPENETIAAAIFLKLKEKGFIYQKDMELTYCEHDKRFLPDRYVKGECPKCHAKDQYGDVCEVCDTAYKTVDLIDPYCTLCKNKPIRKVSKHYFFKLSAFSKQLKDWLVSNKELQDEIRNQILNWIENGLEDWCISRDGPYFGFRIPGEEDKYFYVWLDAPIGYISSLAHALEQKTPQEHAERASVALREWNQSRILHVIGKDIIYFHLLFWPAMLMGADIRLPENVLVHGHLKVNNEKMSKSRGTFLTAREFLDVLPAKNPELLRFYYAANLGRNMTDLDLDLAAFTDRINSELVSNIANFIYRSLSFIEKHFANRIPRLPTDETSLVVLGEAENASQQVIDAYARYDLRQAVNGILALSSLANKYFQDNEPWKLIKTAPEKAAGVLAVAANLAKDIIILLKPIMPETCAYFETQLDLPDLRFSDIATRVEDKGLGKVAILLHRIEPIALKPKADAASSSSSSAPASSASLSSGASSSSASPEAASAFGKLDLRVATITEVRRHPNAEKLYIEQIDLGTEKRQIVSGLVPFYKEDELVGKHVIVVTNLKPANLRGIESKGMLLAAEQNGVVGLLLAPDAAPGTRVDQHKRGGSFPSTQITYAQFSSVKIEVKDKHVLCDGLELSAGTAPILVDKVTNGHVR